MMILKSDFSKNKIPSGIYSEVLRGRNDKCGECHFERNAVKREIRSGEDETLP